MKRSEPRPLGSGNLQLLQELRTWLKQSLQKLALSCLLLTMCSTGYALDLELTQGINAALPIAINSFGTDVKAQDFTKIINDDLRLSGQFKIIAPPVGANENQVALPIWKSLGADSLVKGAVRKIGSDQYDIRFDLMDVAAGRSLLKKDFQVSEHDLRALAHHISDMIYEKLTGEKGVFSTRIAYIHVLRNQRQSRYSLEVADADGYNPQPLLISTEPIMSPSWSPDGKQIAYVSFEKRKAQVYTVTVATGDRRLITNFNGLNNAPAWSPDGHQLAVVLSKGGNPKIYTVDLSNGSLKQLTFGESIDTEPRFSPDGQSILFTSDRGGNPQIYTLSLNSGAINRITFDGKYNAHATYTPNKKNIVLFHKEEDARFNIAVHDVNSGRLSILTSSVLDDSPSISPNGRLILYATRYQDKGVLGIVSVDGRIHMRLPAREGDVQEPAWAPYLG